MERDSEVLHRDQVGDWVVETRWVREEEPRDGERLWVETRAVLDDVPLWGDCASWEGKDAALRQHLSVAAGVDGREAEFRLRSAIGELEMAEDALDEATRALVEGVTSEDPESIEVRRADVESAEKDVARARARSFNLEVAQREWEEGLREELRAHGIRPSTYGDPAFAWAWKEAALALRTGDGEWSRRARDAGAGVQPVADAPRVLGSDLAGAHRLVVVADAGEALALWQVLKARAQERSAAILCLAGPLTDRRREWVADEARTMMARATGRPVKVELALPETRLGSETARELRSALAEALPGVEIGRLAPDQPSWVQSVVRRERDWIRQQGLQPRDRERGESRGISL